MSDTGKCVFCKIIAGVIPAAKVYEDGQTLAFLDIAPFEKGHVLVVPKRHAPMLTDLPEEDAQAAMRVTREIGARLLARLPCDGFNVLQNNGVCASQTVPHVHFHVIPRRNGQPFHWTPGQYASPEEVGAMQAKLRTDP
ncbi:MAG: HIT family protein [Kiritimatiellaeota bacterium]|nr:HIT family protein [Kiritimatiellota bacterium]